MLTEEQRAHVAMTVAWTRWFRKLSKQHHVPYWRFDQHTVRLLRAVQTNNEPLIAQLHSERDHHLFGAMHFKVGRIVTVHCQVQHFDKDFAYMDRWDDATINRNLPWLVFIGQHRPDSYATFAELFGRFMTAKDEPAVRLFAQYVEQRFSSYSTGYDGAT